MLTTKQKTAIAETRVLLRACRTTLELYGYCSFKLDEQATATELRRRLGLSEEELTEAMEMMQERAEAIVCRS